MSIIESELAGSMILRAWIEQGHQRRLRVRIIRMSGEAGSRPVTSAAKTVDEACEVVRAWLEELLGT